MSTAIDIRDLRKVFPPTAGVKAAAAVDGVSLSIEPGELFFLLGPSGCGKTTLLRMIAGFIEPTGGSIHFRDAAGVRDVTHLPAEKRNTGMVFQSYALWPHMTVAQNVAFGLEVRKVSAAERASRVNEALAAVRMEPYASRRPTQLSGGQQQRVALARALVIRPSVLLLDEPLSNLDAKLRIELRAEIRRVCKQAGITTVYVTHDQKEALSMADRMAVLDAGKVVQVGPPREVYRRPRSRFVAEFLGETNIFTGIVREVTAAGALVECAFGSLVAEQQESQVSVNTEVMISVRPESIRLASGKEPSIRATLRDSVYLGDTAQHTLRTRTGEVVRCAALNPGGTAVDFAHGGELFVSADPLDVVLLPLSPR